MPVRQSPCATWPGICAGQLFRCATRLSVSTSYQVISACLKVVSVDAPDLLLYGCDPLSIVSDRNIFDIDPLNINIAHSGLV
jgi:hypothetical protein